MTPIAFWRSPETGRPARSLEDDIYPFVPPAIINAMEQAAKDDTRHTGTNITITALLGCPRQFFLERCLPVGGNPLTSWLMFRGTWLHKMMGQYMPDDWYTEERDRDKCVVKGTLFGIEISALLDCYKKDFSELADWKFSSDRGVFYLNKYNHGRAKPDHAAQVNMQRLLLAQTTGEDLANMIMRVWSIASAEIHRGDAQFMDEGAIGRIKPGGGNYTIHQIVGMLVEGKEAIDDGKDPLEVVSDLPMVGEKMFGAKKCTEYCSVREECFKRSQGAFTGVGSVMGI